MWQLAGRVQRIAATMSEQLSRGVKRLAVPLEWHLRFFFTF
jgi:hypothetical protein